MRYPMPVIYGHPVIAVTRALRFVNHVTKRNGESGDENGPESIRFVRTASEHAQSESRTSSVGPGQRL